MSSFIVLLVFIAFFLVLALYVYTNRVVPADTIMAGFLFAVSMLLVYVLFDVSSGGTTFISSYKAPYSYGAFAFVRDSKSWAGEKALAVSARFFTRTCTYSAARPYTTREKRAEILIQHGFTSQLGLL